MFSATNRFALWCCSASQRALYLPRPAFVSAQTRIIFLIQISSSRVSRISLPS